MQVNLKSRSHFPLRLSYQAIYRQLQTGQCVEIATDSPAHASKLRKSAIASMRRYLTSSETLTTSVDNHKLLLLLVEKA